MLQSLQRQVCEMSNPWDDWPKDDSGAAGAIAWALVLVLLLAWSNSKAETVNLSCKPPTLTVDNAPITAPLAYKAYWGTNADSLTNPLPLAGPGCKGPVIVPDAPSGAQVTYYFAITASNGPYESGPSNIASKTVTGASIPPKELQVIEPTAYRLDLGHTNQIKLSKIGTIPVGTRCVAQQALGMNVVAYRQLAVLDAGKSRPLAVLAKCG